MVIKRVTPFEIVSSTASALGLPPKVIQADGAPFIAAIIRRVAGARCPCSAATLISAAMESLQHLLPSDSLRDRLADAVESLIVMGDLLELSQVTIDDPDARGTWLFIAPPSFVARPNGSIIVTGISPDETAPLPVTIGERIQYEGVARILYPNEGEDLVATLRDLGLVELSTTHWLKAPIQVEAHVAASRMARQLADRSHSGTISGLVILTPSSSVMHYGKRWTKPKDEMGSFVARRPQAYGAPLWGYVELAGGQPVKLLDFPTKEQPYRGCDVAWHLQMALDFMRGAPQRYRLRLTPEGPCLDVFSPLPLWAERRLRILGRSIDAKDCLISYVLPERQVALEEGFLQDRLWLARLNNE